MYYSIKTYSLFILSVSCIALIAAYSMQFFFHLEPCILCQYQRIPYFFTALFSALFLYIALHTRNNALAAYYLCCMFMLFVIGMGIGFFHFGVENGWFIYKSTCTGYVDIPSSIEALKHMLEEAPTIPCDIPGPMLLGLSIAGWNGIIFFWMSVLTMFMILYRSKGN